MGAGSDMANVVKINIGGQDFDAIEQQFEIGKEEWSEYKLFDGGVIRLKTTVQKIFRVVDANGNPAFTADGDPHVVVRHQTQIVASG